jgi:hypothetical protein
MDAAVLIRPGAAWSYDEGTDLVTVLASPKPAVGRTAEIQRLALGSWLRLHNNTEVVLFGSAARDLATKDYERVTAVSEISTSPAGIPIFNAIVDWANTHARYERMVYTNADIILGSHHFDGLLGARFDDSVLIGERIDLSPGLALETLPSDLESEAERLVREGLALRHGPTGTDYFIFRRGAWAGLPPVVIGRAGFDNALLAHCISTRTPLVDVTACVTALHQFHDYSHVPSGMEEAWWGTDAAANKRIHHVEHGPPDLREARWVLTSSEQLIDNPRRGRVRRLEMHVRYRLRWRRTSLVLRAVGRVADLYYCRQARQ